MSVDSSPSSVDAYASRASLICANQANLWSCDVCRSWGSEVPWMRAFSWGRSSVSPFCHSCVTLSLSSLVGILSTPVRSWSVSFQCFQIVQLNSHSASVSFLAQKGALFHCRVAVIYSCCIASNCLAVCPRRKLC
jgi:hypothetical protein